MGAHSLGGAHPENSGYQGKWTGLQNRGFNELYYLNMINATNKWLNVVRSGLTQIFIFNLAQRNNALNKAKSFSKEIDKGRILNQGSIL
jgi:hypothetical protein